MPGREGSVLSVFPFPRKGPGSFLFRGGKELPVCLVEGFRVSFCFDEGYPPIPVFLAGIQPFSVFLGGKRVFSFPRREGSRFSRGMRRRVSYFFLFRGRDPTCFFSIGSGSFRTRRGAFPRATALSTSPGRTSEIEGIQLPGSSRSPVDQRFFRKRTDSCFPLFLFSSNRSNLSLVSTNRSNLSLVS